MAQESQNKRNYTSVPFEIFVAILTILPFVLLAYFYPVLSDRVPLYMKPNGEVAVWGEKSLLTVFRVPLITVLAQVTCLLLKHGPRHSIGTTPIAAAHAELRERQLSLNAGLWDWFRWTAALKLNSEAIEIIFLGIPRFNSLARPAYIATAFTALLGVVGALIYAYRLLVVTREIKKQFGAVEKPLDLQRVYGGVFYFNRSDPALFVAKYGLNFANGWAWALITCAIGYSLLAFLPGW